MSQTTAARLDPIKMDEIKELIISKFAAKRSMADKEEIWSGNRPIMQTAASKEQWTYINHPI